MALPIGVNVPDLALETTAHLSQIVCGQHGHPIDPTKALEGAALAGWAFGIKPLPSWMPNMGFVTQTTYGVTAGSLPQGEVAGGHLQGARGALNGLGQEQPQGLGNWVLLKRIIQIS